MTVWHAIRDHPILRLEVQRAYRKRWWPGRRFFALYPAALGVLLGCGIAFALGDLREMRLAASASAVPGVCLLSALAGVLSSALPWLVPAFTALPIARERELGTLDLLRTTLLTERSIVLGKLGGCVVWLWPGLLTLALLTPFRLAWAFGGVTGGLSSLAFLSVLDAGLGLDIGDLWVWLLVAGVAGLLKPWGDLVLHAAVGLFASVLARSVGVALAVAYGAILVVRMTLWLVTSWLLPVLPMLGVSWGWGEAHIGYMLAATGLVSLGVVVAEMAGGCLLTWAAIQWLKWV